MPPKRRKDPDAGEDERETPKRPRRTRESGETPAKRQSIVKDSLRNVHLNGDKGPTPRSSRRVLFSTPNDTTETDKIDDEDGEAPITEYNDRSARRKSARMLQRNADRDMSEDEESLEGEAALAEKILNEEDESGEDDEEEQDEGEDISVAVKASTTPSKRGRPKGKRREPSPPPQYLSPHELYFSQNRTGANKTSANTLPTQLLLKHEDYFAQIKAYDDPHQSDIRQLEQYHRRAFDQWVFEIEEGYNLCLYGYGSKRALMMQFAEYLSANQTNTKAKIVVVNGYTPTLTVRDILTTVASVIMPNNTKLPAQSLPLLELLLDTLTNASSSTSIRLIIHSIDHFNLRRSNTQSIIARLASHRSICLVASCDTLHFPLLWDTSLLRQLRWLYHDCTTFQPYSAEMDAVDEVNTLLARTGRRLGGKDGVGYVLKSLPENARNLFRILLAEQLASADAEPSAVVGAVGGDFDADDILGTEDEEEALAQQDTPSRRKRGRPPKKAVKRAKPVIPVPAEGVEYRTLYHKAVEEFVCSSELNFRTLLKEFHDHQMIESRKDALGTERLIVPFRREEMETILEELV